MVDAGLTHQEQLNHMMSMFRRQVSQAGMSGDGGHEDDREEQAMTNLLFDPSRTCLKIM